MDSITVKTKSLDYIKKVIIIPALYENGSLYIGLYDSQGELYTDLSTYILPVLPGTFYVEKNSEKERFVKEQNTLFTDMEKTIKQGFNTYALYYYNGYTN